MLPRHCWGLVFLASKPQSEPAKEYFHMRTCIFMSLCPFSHNSGLLLWWLFVYGMLCSVATPPPAMAQHSACAPHPLQGFGQHLFTLACELSGPADLVYLPWYRASCPALCLCTCASCGSLLAESAFTEVEAGHDVGGWPSCQVPRHGLAS